MNISCFISILVHRPWTVIAIITVLSGTCFFIPFTLKTKSLPNFLDPQMGFSTRGTMISNRLTAWQNLVKSTRPSGQFAINPKDILVKNRTFVTLKTKKNKIRKLKEKNSFAKIFINDSNRTDNNNYSINNWKALKKLLYPKNSPNISIKPPISHDTSFCGYPDEKYAHIVLKSQNQDLFTISSLLALCRIEHELIEIPIYQDLCIENNSKCCKPWSLANYIAILHNRTSCLAITENDVKSTKSLLVRCERYFHNLQLMPDCEDKGYCDAPLDCIKHDAVFNIFNFLTTTTFLPDSNTSLFETIIFLPIACSVATLPFYHKLEKMYLSYENVEVVAMEFGIKSALFDEYLLNDVWLMCFGASFVFFCIWLYTKSLFLTIMALMSILFSLIISYFIYNFVFNIVFFPFMNLLVIIVVIGIGADDAFIFCKIWENLKKNNVSLMIIMNDTFKHAISAILVTTLTTCVAFLTSYNTSVTAICCFSIFAGMTIIINFLLMISLFPACVILWETKFCCLNTNFFKNFFINCLKFKCTLFNNCLLKKLWNCKQELLFKTIINLRYLWVILLSLLAFISSIIVLYYPKLELPDSAEFQLFKMSHPFEQYDFKYKNHFWFKRNERVNLEQVNYRLPLRFVWGILPIDKGDYLNPVDFGDLSIDESFDITEVESQIWLLEFCKNLRRQSFYGSNLGPILPNCFIETFMKSMQQRKCVDPFSLEDRSPCCETTKFPYNITVFNKCIIEEMSDIYETPRQYLIPGMAGPKFSKDEFPKIKAVIIEYDSNYTYSMSFEYMANFFEQVETWMEEQLKTAPKAMKNGWFISELEFYDLQRELSRSTLISIVMSMGLALVVLVFSTNNIFISLYAILTITCSIFVTIAVLVLLGWKLNILESITVSTAIGLTVDFSLHYAINYKLCPIDVVKDRLLATKFAISNMAGPSIMAAITTGAAGAFMLPSMILPYIQIGIFLVIVMSISWIYATFYLGAILAIAGPENGKGQFNYSNILICYRSVLKKFNNKSTNTTDNHELNFLTKHIRPNKLLLQRSFSGNTSISDSNETKVGKFFTDQSPSATSAITVIMSDDN